ncbi:unnamed protein product [Schistosoma haematobium]|nr:unnamed protein product [Schistosoma haematobium]
MKEVSTKPVQEEIKTMKMEEKHHPTKLEDITDKPKKTETSEKVAVKEAVVDETPVESETVPVSTVSKGVVERTDMKSTVGVTEESGSVAEQETLVVEQVAVSKEIVTVKMEERVAQEVEKESVAETMEWVSEGVGELEESDRQDSARVVEQPSEVGVAVSETQVEVETVELVSVKEAVVDETPVESDTVSVLGVTEEKSVVSATEDFAMEVEQVTLTVDEVSPRMESLTSSAEERVVSEAVPLEETVYDVYETEQVEAVTRPTTDAVASGVVSSTTPSLSDVVSAEEVPSEVTEAGDTMTAKTAEVIVEEGKESVSQTMEWVSEGVGELEESDRQDSARVVEQPSEVGVAVSETQVEVETVELVSVKEAVVDETPVESDTVSVLGVTEEKSVVSATEDFAMEVEQVTLTVDEVSPRMESLTSSAEERVVSEAVPLEETVYDVYETEQVEAVTRPTTDAVASGVVSSTTPSLSDVVSAEEVPSEVTEAGDTMTAKTAEVIVEEGKESVSQTMEWVSEGVGELEESDRQDSARVVEQPSEVGVAVSETQVEVETVELVSVKEAVVDETPVESDTVSVLGVTEEKSVVSATEDFAMEVEQVTLTVDEVSPRMESLTSSAEERVVSEAVPLEETVYDVYETEQVEAVTRPTTDAVASGVVSSTTPSLSDVVSAEEVPSEQVTEAGDTMTAKTAEVIVEEGKESVSQTMEWVSEGVGELEESDRQDSARVVEQPSEVGVAVSETQVEVETVELVSVKEAVVDETPVESDTVSVLGVTEEKSVVSATEDFAMEVEQVTLTVDEVSPRMESLTSSAEERVVSEAVPLEETVYDVYETEQVEAVTRPTTDAVASGVVSSTTPSLSDVVSAEEVPSEQVTEAGDTMTAKTAEVIVEEGKESVSQTMEWVSEGVGELEESDRQDSARVVEQPSEVGVAVSETQVEVETVELVSVKEAVVDETPVESDTVSVLGVTEEKSVVSATEDFAMEVEQVTLTVDEVSPRMESLTSSAEERVVSEAVPLEETVYDVYETEQVEAVTRPTTDAVASGVVSSTTPSLSDVVSAEEVPSEVTEAGDTMTAKTAEVIVEEGKESVSQTMEWVSEGVGELEESDRQDSARVVEQPSEVGVAVSETQVEVETVELVSVKEAVVDETPVESDTVSVLGVTEEKSVVSATEDFAMEVEQVTLTVDEVSPRMESLTSSAEERVVSEAVPLEETVYDVYETEQVEAVTRPTTDAVASGVVSSTTPSLSDVVSAEEVPSEVTEAGDTMTAKTAEVIVEEGKESVSQTMEWVSEGVGELEESDRQDSARVVEQPSEVGVAVSETQVEVETVELVSVKEAVVDETPVESDTVSVLGVTEEKSVVSATEDFAMEVEQVTLTVDEVSPRMESLTSSAEERVVSEAVPLEETVYDVYETEQVEAVTRPTTDAVASGVVSSTTPSLSDVVSAEEVPSEQVTEAGDTMTAKTAEVIVEEGKESVSQTMEWVSEGVGELEESDRQDSARVVEQPSEVGVAVSETQVEVETVELVSVKEAVVDETPVESDTVSVLGVTEEKSVVSATEDFAMEVEQVTLTVDEVSPRMESLTSSAEERVVSEAVPLEETVYDVYETEQVEAVTRPTTDAVASGVVSSTTPSLSDVVSAEEVPSEQVTEAGDTMTAKTAEVIVEEGKESVSQTMEWVSEGVGELEESDRQDSARVVEQPSEVGVAVSETQVEVETVELVSVKEAVVDETPVESDTVSVLGVTEEKSVVSATEDFAMEVEQVTLTVDEVSPRMESLTSSAEERVVSEAVPLEETVYDVYETEQVEAVTRPTTDAVASGVVSSTTPSLSDVVSAEEVPSEVKPPECSKPTAPSTPVNIKVIIIPPESPSSKSKLHINWQQPDDIPVTNFYIELKPSNSKTWQDVSADFTITEPDAILPTDNLQEFVSYEFRVIAENEEGKSHPSLPSNSIELGIPLEFIRPLTDITVSAVTNEPVILECELSRTPREKIQWFKDGKALPSRLSSRIKVEELENGKVHRIIFSPLTEEDLGVYSVKVENLTSEARVDMKIAPTLKLSESFSDKVIMKAGEAAVFEIPFVASPKPTVTWSWRPRTRPDAELGSAQTPRFKADVVSGLTSLPVSKVKREDAGEYSVVISNELGEVTVSIELIVLDKPSVPRNLVASDNTGESVLFSWTEPEFLGLHPDVGVSDGLSYVVEMRESNQRASRSVTVTSELNTLIDKLQVNKSYVFSVAAKNDVGQSEFAETSPVSTKLEYGPPSSPVNVKAVVNPPKASIKDQTIELTWEQPTDQVSASGPVTNFYIELKPEDSTRWQDVSADFTITEPHFTLPTDKLQEFVSYEFRVTSENKAGKSKPSSPSNAVQLGIPLEFIRPLTDITVSAVTNEPVILECELSRTPREKIQWFKDGKALPSRLSSRIKVEELENGKVHRIIFSPLTEEDLGVYSVKVENLTSEARVDMKIAPTLKLSESFSDKVIMKAGEAAVFEIPFVASPKPTVTWSWRPRTRPDAELGSAQTPRFKADVVSGLTSLPVSKVKREDAGEYSVVISNELGEVTVSIELIVLDKPSVPRNLVASDNTGESVLFSWTEPEFLGLHPDVGVSDGLSYVVEMRESNQRASRSVTVTSELNTLIDKLQVNKSYVFSVAAKNDVGQSEFAETSPVSTKLEYGPPSSPVNVKAVVNPPKASIKDQTIELTWEQPTDQVSASGPVTNFYIELKPEDSTRWQDVSADFTITEPHFTLPTDKLQEFVSYEFRVTSENKAGKSKPSSPSNAVQLGVPLEFIRPLTDLTVDKVTNEPVILECELSRTPRDKVQWLKDGKPIGRLPDRVTIEELENGKIHRVNFTSLMDDDLGVYSLRVEKLSSECRLDMKVPPTLRLSDSFSDRVIIKAGGAMVFEIPFTASPKPKVEWTWRQRSRPDGELGPVQSPRFKADVVSGLTSLPVSKVKREDAGDYTVVISNELGEVSVTIQMIVIDKPSVPRDLEVSENSGESVLLSWKEPEFVGLSTTTTTDVSVSGAGGLLEYVVEMRESSQRAGRGVRKTSELSVRIDDLQINKSYVFSVAAKNDVGQSEFAETKPVSTKLDYGPPSSPVNVKAVVNPPKASIKDQTIELTWEQPTDQVSASGPVTNFYIELKPEDSTRWQDVSADFTITEPHFTLPTDKLQEFVSYEFRVTSENKAGKSKPSSPSNAIRLGVPLEFVRPLTDLTVDKVTNEPVILECELSRTPRDKVQWLKDGKPIGRLPDRVTIEELENGKIHRVNFTSLMDDDLGVYSLRVEKLSSECRLDMKVPPKLRLSDSFSDRVIIKAGGAMVFEIPFTASPKPKVEWTWRQRSRPDGELGPVQSPRFKADVVSGLTSLPVSKVKREDAGDYTVVISNELGEVSVTIQMIVIDKPSVPRDLEVSENSGESVLLSWKEPEFVGLSTTTTTDVSVSGAGGLLEYVVEMRESSQRAGRGVRKTSELSVRIDDLQINKSYVFSVAAKNDVGQSEFAETKPVSTKLDYGPPLSPVNVKAVVNPPKASIKDQTIELTWEQPTDQVSASGPVTNFYIELKPEDSTRWQDVSADFTITEPHFTLPTDKLQEFVSYEFRVTSENKAGKSKPSSPSNAVQLGIPLEFVRPLIHVTVNEVDEKPVVLECELSRSPRDKVQWLKDGKSLSRLPNYVSVEESSDKKIHSIKFRSLTDDDLGVYTIKVEKLSSEAKLSMKVPPTLRLSDSFSDRVIIKAGGAMVFEIPFTASPKPKVEWTWRQRSRPDGELGPVQSPRFKADVVSGLTSLPVSKVKREDAGDYTVVISNELGEVSVTIQVIVIDKPSVPRDLEVSENSGESVLLSWKEPEFVGLSTTTTTDVSVSGAGGLLEYVVEMRESSQRAGRGVRKTSELSVRIDDLQINKSYVFSVAAKNDVGQSEFAETKPVSTKLDYGPPTPPLNVTASVSPSYAEPEDQMITVNWSEPETATTTTTSTGASPLYYTVEYRVDEGRVWNKLVCGKEVTGMKLDFPPIKENLSAGKSYDFRVIAVNKAGTSEPSKPSNSIQLGIVLEFIRQLEDLIITNIEPIEYKLECELSRKPRTMIAWTKDNKPLIIRPDDTHMKFIDQGTIQSIHFTHLIDTDIGDYAIQVENISSKCKLEIKAPPTIRISDQFEDHITLKAGTTKILEIPFISSPKPKIKWTWAPSTDLTQEQTPRFKPDIVAGLTTLPLSRVKREDSGAYKVKISNDLGEISITIHVIVIDKPSPPRNLTITDATEKSVMFNWDLPVNVNENESLEYVVNYRDATKYSSQPINVCVTKELKTFIDGLKLGSQYIFSVCARNEVGDSAFAESQAFLMKYSFDPPEAPGIPQVTILESGHVSLEWTPPSSDGGSPITEYFIESMDERPVVKGRRRTSTYGSRAQWNSLTSGIIFEPNVQPKASVTGLSPDKQYTFRVCAVNKAGKGPFSPPSESCLPLIKPPKVPGKPGPITVGPLNETSVNLSWTPGTVNEDFGPADYYIIEACEDDGNDWKEVGKTTKPDDCNLNVNNLDSSTRYQFRVRGVNKEGVGEPSKPSERICLKKDAPLVITKELESIHLNEIPQTIEYECHLSKLPQKVQWFYNNKRLDTSNLRKYRFIDDGKIQKLEVLKITLNDVGEYSIKIDKLESKATFEIDLPPKLCLPDDFSDTIILAQGNNRNIEIPFTSCPPATSIVWYWNGSRTLPDPTKRTVPDNDSKSQVVLRLTAVQVSDAGIYEAIITNPYGEAKATVTLKVLGVPGPVTSLEAHVESPTEVSVLWKPPEDDGGSPLTGYKVEQRQLAPEPGGVLRSQAKEWKLIANVSLKSKTSNDEEPFVHRITGLTEGATYLFGVSAVNDCGSGPRKEISDGLIMKSPYDIPEIPKQLTAKPINHSTIELEFKLPVTHVEAPLTSVIVEYRPKSVSRWKTQTFEPCSIVQIDKLEANTEYEFRVSCTNLAGKSESSNPVKAKTKQLPKPPDAPKLDNVTPVNTNSVKVNWFSPTNDGDSPITSYQIEMCDAKNGTEVWKPIDALNIDRTDQSLLSPDEQKSYELIVKNLDNSKSFKFRVIAVNSIGPGKPSRSSQPVTPGIEVNIIRPLNNVCFDEIPKSGTKVELECELSQSNCRVNWLYNGKPIVLGKKYDFSPEGNVYRLIINDITLEDMGVYELNYKKLKTQCKVEAKIPPTLLEDTEESHTRRINVGSNCVFEVPFKAYPKPTIKWLAQNIPITDKTKRYQVNIVAGLTSLSIQRVQNDDTGQLIVIIENEHGKLTWKCELIVIDKPKPVENLTVEPSIDRLHMIMNWKPPRKDLNNPITHYELEYRNSKNRSWQTFKNGPLDVDDLYKIPNNLTKFEIKITEKETANSLAPNTDYYFRIIVVNEVGKSEPTETRSFIKTPSLPKPPKLKYDKTLETCKTTTGQKHSIPVSVEGEPSPQIDWKFIPDGHPSDERNSLPSDAQTEASGPDQDGVNKIALKFRKISRSCDGTYILTAVNNCGEARAEFHVTVLGLPSAPQNLIATNLSKTSIRLNWSPPTDTGGSQILNYVIEQAVVKSNLATLSSVGYWEPVTRNLPVHEASDGSTGYIYDIINLASEKYMLFRVAAQNKQGIGEFEAITSPLLVTSPHNLPGPPKDLNGTTDKDGQVHLEWKPPQHDGGAKIMNYIIEKCLSLKDANWSEIKLPDSPNTMRIIPNLRDGICYFRVSAVSDAGKGSPSNIIDVDVKKGSDKPDQPGQPTVEVIADGAVQLRWSQPLNEGTGGPINGYEVQICEVGSIKWKPSSSDLCSVNEIRLTGLNPAQDYLFRVIAVNDAGLSLPSEHSRPIRPATDVDFVRPLENQSITELPSDVVFECELSRPGMTLIWSKDGRDLNLSSRCVYSVIGEGDKAFCIHRLTLIKVSPDEQGVYSARLVTGKKTEAILTIECPPKILYDGPLEIQLLSGKSTVIEVPYTGAPFPDVNWSFNHGPLPIGAKRESPIASVDTVYGLTCLRLRHVTGEITGNYKLLISNELGKATLELIVKVLDVPGPVRQLKATVQNQPSGTASLTWQAPKEEGGSPIIGYLVEKREANKRSWTPFGSQVKELSCVVDGLTTNTGYFFRVMAQNISGCSEPTETDISVVIPCLTKPPSAPGTPEASDIGTDSCRVSWEPPSSDGGARLTFYHLEKRANLKGNWVRACADKLPILTNEVKSTYVTKVTGLVPDNVYEFRVAAENADFMVGEYSNSSHRISTQLPFSVPGKPSRPEIQNITETTIGLAWKTPYDDGGDSVKKYVVQYKTTSSSEWKTVSEMPVDLEFTVAHLQSDEQYEFRVAAINSAGQGPWSDTSEPCNPAKAIESSKPSLVNPLINVTVLVGQSVELNCDFKLGEPKGNVTWFKDGKPIRSQVKYSTSPAWERRANLKINRTKLEDAGVFSCVAENPSGKVETTCRVIVAQKPILNLELDKSVSSNVTGILSKSDHLTGRVGGCLALKATCEAFPDCEAIVWFINGKQIDSSLDSELLSRVIINDTHTSRILNVPKPQVSILTISNLHLSDAGEYGCSSVNEVGTAQSAIKLILNDRPQPPMSIEVTETRGQDWIEVKWERPSSDGGSKLTRYIIERRVIATSTSRDQPTSIHETNWSNVGQAGPYDDHLRIQNCKPGTVYSFRIFAENEIGISDPTEIESPYQMKLYTDLPLPPTHVTAERSSPREAKIQWRPPISDDGDSIQGYMVELRETADPKDQYTSRWTQASPKLIRSGTTLKVDDLHPDMFVQFRVRARNLVGFSEPSEPSDWIEPIVKKPRVSIDESTRKKDDTTKLPKDDKSHLDIVQEIIALKEASRPKKIIDKDAPRIQLINEDTYRLRPGNNLRVGVHLDSVSKANVELLTASGQPLLGNALGRTRIEQFGDDFYVNLRNINLSDAGTYCIKAINTAGESNQLIHLIVLTEPLPPKSPLIAKVIESPKGHSEGATVELTWGPSPLRDGESPELTSPVLGYCIERREGQRRQQFNYPIRLVGSDKLSVKIPDLKPGIEYVFRVSSYNDVGPSEPTYSEPLIIKSPYGVPDAPKGPLVCSDLTDSSLKLTWLPPEDNGGLPVKRYYIEMKDVGNPAGWIPLGIVSADSTSYLVSGLQQGFAYRFRVRVANDEGLSDWLETDKSISFRRPVTKPSQPEGPLRMLPDGDRAVRLTWNAPLDDGGSPIKDFIVELCLDRSGEHWQPIGEVRGLNKRIENLIPDGIYSFRVSARNEDDKVGPPLYSEIYKPGAPMTPPGQPVGPLKATCIGIGQVKLEWKPPIVGGQSGCGVPDEYLIERYEQKKARWAYVTRQSASTGTTVVVSNLQPGSECQFRVRAENRAGSGPFLESDRPITVISPFNPPDPPQGPINISEVQMGASRADCSARISWRPPLDTGGLPLIRYVLQMRYANTPGWHRVTGLQRTISTDEISDKLDTAKIDLATTSLVTGLMQGQRYIFRVAAVNEVGTGAFLESETFEMPEDDSCKPKADWVRIAGKSADSVTVEWLVPHDCRHDHGPNRAHHLAIDGFRVFVRPATTPQPSNISQWQQVAELDHYLNRLVVGNLKPNQFYYFGVAAVNQSGQGEIISTKEPVCPEAITTVPSQPIGPLQVSNITDNSCQLSWLSPASDGGSPTLGYRIYKREMYRRSWQEIGRITELSGLTSSRQLQFQVQYLMHGTAYEFRVVAENKNGLSEPLDTQAQVHPAKETSKL